MAANFKNFSNGIGLVPNSGSVVSIPGDVSYNSGTAKFEVYATSVEALATNDNTLTFTAKSIDTGGSNTIGSTAIAGATGTGSIAFSVSPTFTGTVSVDGQFVNASSLSNAYLANINNTNTTAGTSFGLFISAGTNSSDSALSINNASNTSPLFRVMGNGFVGIGSDTPSHFLEVQKSLSNNHVAKITNTNTTAGTSFGLEIAAGTNSTDASLTVLNAAQNATLFLVKGDGDIQSTGNVSGANLSGTNTGDVSLTAVGSSPSANGASLSGQTLTLQPADATHPGLVTTGTQTIAGNKTFTGTITTSSALDINGDFVTATGIDSSTGTINALSTSGKSVIRFSNSTTITLNGIANGSDGKRVILMNATGNPITINYLSSSALAANQIVLPNSTTMTISNNGACEFIYSGPESLWRAIAQ